MCVRIVTTTAGERTIVHIAGRLRSPEVPELDREIRSVIGPFVLDLSELVSADESGIEKLRELATQGAELCGVSPYVRLLLDERESG